MIQVKKKQTAMIMVIVLQLAVPLATAIISVLVAMVTVSGVSAGKYKEETMNITDKCNVTLHYCKDRHWCFEAALMK